MTAAHLLVPDVLKKGYLKENPQLCLSTGTAVLSSITVTLCNSTASRPVSMKAGRSVISVSQGTQSHAGVFLYSQYRIAMFSPNRV